MDKMCYHTKFELSSAKDHKALEVFAKRYITLKNQSLQNGLKLIPQISIQPPDYKNIKFDHFRSKL